MAIIEASEIRSYVAPPDARFAGPHGELRTFNRGKVTAAEVPARTMNQEIALARWHYIYIIFILYIYINE